MSVISRKITFYKSLFISKWINRYQAPELNHVDDLIDEISASIRDSDVSEAWKSYGKEIIASLQAGNVSGFLRFPTISVTVHPNQFQLSSKYRSYIFNSRKFTPSLHLAMTESPVGHPFLDPFYSLSSPVLIQHVYHLTRLMEYTSLGVSDFKHILDFGAGYGSVYRLFRNMAYNGKYTIFDLPMMCAIQRFYLRNVYETNFPSEKLNWLSGSLSKIDAEINDYHGSLFLASFSLSECPMQLRQELEASIKRFETIMIVYQGTFRDFDNRSYFKSLETNFTEFSWLHEECPLYEGNYYMIGRKG